MNEKDKNQIHRVLKESVFRLCEGHPVFKVFNGPLLKRLARIGTRSVNGKKHVLLEAVKVGGIWYSSLEAVDRFIEAVHATDEEPTDSEYTGIDNEETQD